MTPEQKEIRRTRASKWNAEHRERCSQNRRLYYEQHKEEIKAQLRARAKWPENLQKNRERVAAFKRARPWYNSWQMARARCTNPQNSRYTAYGGRGIRFLLSKADMVFMWQRDQADLQNSPSLDRINNAGDYTLENCHFIEKPDNSRKRALDNWRKRSNQ